MLGLVQLRFEKGARDAPANWRPICLQQAIYKLYTGVLARRLMRWLDANDRHAPGQKGFRAVNGFGEHNFLAATPIGNGHRNHCSLYEAWYDFRNAFVSVPLSLLCDDLDRTSVTVGYISMCQGLYSGAEFMIGSAVDGLTAPIQQRVGGFQGCPLSPHLFSVAISPLLHALARLQESSAQISSEDRPGVSAYADDLKIFSGTKEGIAQKHGLVAEFCNGLAWRPTLPSAEVWACGALRTAPLRRTT